MAQWIRHRPTESGIVGSSPTRIICVHLCSLMLPLQKRLQRGRRSLCVEFHRLCPWKCVCVCARVLSPRVRVARPVSWRGHECHDMGAVFSLHGRRAAQYTGVGRENCKAWGGLHLRLKRKVICCGDTYLN